MNDNVTMSAMRGLVIAVANFWAQHIRPMPFDGVFHLSGVRVRVQIDEYKTAEDTQPMKAAQ